MKTKLNNINKLINSSSLLLDVSKKEDCVIITCGLPKDNYCIWEQEGKCNKTKKCEWQQK